MQLSRLLTLLQLLAAEFWLLAPGFWLLNFWLLAPDTPRSNYPARFTTQFPDK